MHSSRARPPTDWSLPRRGREGTTRAMTAERAELFVALVEAAPYTITLDGRPGSRAELYLNGSGLGEAVLDQAGRAVTTVFPEAIRPGVNILIFTQKERAPFELSRVRWMRPGD